MAKLTKLYEKVCQRFDFFLGFAKTLKVFEPGAEIADPLPYSRQ